MADDPMQDEIARDLEALRSRLADMAGDDVAAPDTEAMASSITRIRAQLNRIEQERRAWVEASAGRAARLNSGPRSQP